MITPRPEARNEHRRWLLELTTLPTAAGREWRIERWVRLWAQARPGLTVEADPAGNLVIAMEPGKGEAEGFSEGPPVFLTAHMDHPAFVVERIVSPTTVELAFRGGVMDDYFDEAKIRVFAAGAKGEHAAKATISERTGEQDPFKRFLAELDTSDDQIAVGDVGVWELPEAEIDAEGVLHTNACDDLAALVGALAALDELHRARKEGEQVRDTRVLLTRAEEIGFIGAIGACRNKTMPEGSRVIALENSRSFIDSPVGGGPIVRVGDRLSTFSPALTAAVSKRAEAIAGAPMPTASQKLSEAPKWKWQRKLMAGGACEASVFCAYGYEATCVCLPLGNYHNMADLEAVQSGINNGRPRVGREFISLGDFDNMVDLLIACGEDLPAAGGLTDRLDKLWGERSGVLKERNA